MHGQVPVSLLQAYEAVHAHIESMTTVPSSSMRMWGVPSVADAISRKGEGAACKCVTDQDPDLAWHWSKPLLVLRRCCAFDHLQQSLQSAVLSQTWYIWLDNNSTYTTHKKGLWSMVMTSYAAAVVTCSHSSHQ